MADCSINAMCEFLNKKGGYKKNTPNPSAVILYRECTGSITHGGETFWLGYPCQLDPVHSLYGMTANNSHTGFNQQPASTPHESARFALAQSRQPLADGLSAIFSGKKY